MDGLKTEEVLAQAAALADRREPFALVTVVWRRPPSSAKPGAKAVITADGQLFGWIGGGCTAPSVVNAALRALQEGTPRLLHLAPPAELPPEREGVVTAPLTCASEGSVQVFIEPNVPRPQLAVIGDSPVARTLSAMAELLGFDVAKLDPAAPSDASADLREAGVGRSSFVVVATLDRYDETAVEAAIETDAAYIALVASKKRAADVLNSLRTTGIEERQLERVRAPAGLDLGPLPHPEIAVAILAEIVQLKARGIGAAEIQQTPHEVDEVPRREAEALDPVCGMTVRIASASFKTEIDGRTYYFCCDGCRRRFESEPAKYLREVTP